MRQSGRPMPSSVAANGATSRTARHSLREMASSRMCRSPNGFIKVSIICLRRATEGELLAVGGHQRLDLGERRSGFGREHKLFGLIERDAGERGEVEGE